MMVPGQALQGLEVIVIARGREPGGPEHLGRGQSQPERHPLGQGGFDLSGAAFHELRAQDFFQIRQHLVRLVGGDRQVNGVGHFQAAAHRAGHLQPEQCRGRFATGPPRIRPGAGGPPGGRARRSASGWPGRP